MAQGDLSLPLDKFSFDANDSEFVFGHVVSPKRFFRAEAQWRRGKCIKIETVMTFLGVMQLIGSKSLQLTRRGAAHAVFRLTRCSFSLAEWSRKHQAKRSAITGNPQTFRSRLEFRGIFSRRPNSRKSGPVNRPAWGMSEAPRGDTIRRVESGNPRSLAATTRIDP